MTVMGLALAKACSQPGMVATGTRAELVKNKMMTGNRPTLAVSPLRTMLRDLARRWVTAAAPTAWPSCLPGRQRPASA